MATTRLQIFYQQGTGQKWSNVYHIDTTTITDALTAFDDVMKTPLRSFLHGSCRIVRALASSLTDDTFQEQSVELGGTSAFSSEMLPFFNCVKVEVSTTGLGRPDVKFLKGWLTEGNSGNGAIDSSALSDLLGDFNDMITAADGNSTPLVSEDGTFWAIATSSPNIQMRQMHRKRKKVTPP